MGTRRKGPTDPSSEAEDAKPSIRPCKCEGALEEAQSKGAGDDRASTVPCQPQVRASEGIAMPDHVAVGPKKSGSNTNCAGTLEAAKHHIQCTTEGRFALGKLTRFRNRRHGGQSVLAGKSMSILRESAACARTSCMGMRNTDVAKNTVTQPGKALYSKTTCKGIGVTMNWPIIETCKYVFLQSTQAVLGTGIREQETLVNLQGHQVLKIKPARTGVSTSHAGIDTLNNSFSSSCKHTLLGAWLIY